MVTLRAACFLIVITLLPATGMAAEDACQGLLRLSAPNTAITLAEQVTAGGFGSPREAQGGPNDARFSTLPGFCRVAATLTPTPDSDIRIEVWLPSSGWNGKFQAVGNGGWAGVISYPQMALALSHGYATASTDTGHATPGAGFAMGHPEKLHDYAYRAVHEMTVTAKTVINAFYGSVPKLSYFNGCSTGGRQGLIEASRYPEDFDGIVAGAAANPKTRLDTWRIWMALETLRDPHRRIPEEKYPAIHRAVLAACDGLDGVTDGLIEDPTNCRFDARVLACKDGDGPDCLTEGQIQSVTTILGPAKSPRTGAEIFPGYAPGTELRWGHLIGGPDPYDTAVEQFKMVFTDPAWDWRSFDVDRDMAKTEEALHGLLTAIDPASIRPFIDRGGKLLTYHGWGDQSIAPLASVNFLREASAALGPDKAGSSLRLFMVPGMGHCGGGEGPNTFDMMPPLEQWVEQGQPPSRVVASHSTNGKVDRTRPLCAYPAVARHTGTGSIEDAENFVCRVR